MGDFSHIKSKDDLVTTHQETRTGFINFAIEKNKRSTPYIERAKALKFSASEAKTPKDLLKITEIRVSLLTAAGISDKAITHLEEIDKNFAINELIKNFLEPAGEGFIDELVYRYLLTQGDSLGGKMRNLVGALAQQKLTRAILASLNITGIKYKWIDSRVKNVEWLEPPSDEYDVELYLKALCWSYNGKNKILIFNIKVPVVNKNVDICMLNCSSREFIKDKPFAENKKYLLLGELKGGIDPAGADEHWKTANTALGRIRNAFKQKGVKPFTIFIGAAIQNSMAEEIWAQLQSGEMNNAANLTKDNQVNALCNWMIKI